MDSARRTMERNVPASLCQAMKQYYECQKFCDMTLTTKQLDGEVVSVGCHRVVLVASSSYFESILDHTHSTNVDVSPVDMTVLREILAFLYDGDCVLHHTTVVAILETSAEWNLHVLTEVCFKFMDKTKTFDNVCQLYTMSVKYHAIDLKYQLQKYMRDHFKQIFDNGKKTNLSISDFNDIIETDELNWEIADLAFHCALDLIGKDVRRCLQLIRYEHHTDTVMDPESMNTERQRPTYQGASSASESIPRRTTGFWGPPTHFIYVNRDLIICKMIQDGAEHLIKLPDWIDRITSLYQHDSTILYSSCSSTKPDAGKKLLLVNVNEPCYKQELPDLPETIHGGGLINTGSHIYVIGGLRDKPTDNDKESHSDYLQRRSDRVDRLCLVTLKWAEIEPLLTPTTQAITLLHNQYIYVLGNYARRTQFKSAQRYNIKTSTWSFIADLPVACYCNTAAGVIFKDKITVVTKKELMIYQPEQNTWSVISHTNPLESPVSAVVYENILCTCSELDGNYVLMCYNEQQRKWEEKESNFQELYHHRQVFVV